MQWQSGVLVLCKLAAQSPNWLPPAPEYGHFQKNTKIFIEDNQQQALILKLTLKHYD